MMTFGIDVGLTGALSVFDGRGNLVAVEDLPVMASGMGGAKVRQMVDAANLCECLRLHLHHAMAQPSVAYVEYQASRPRMAMQAMFSLGQSYGTVLTALAALRVPYVLIPPKKWKHWYGLSDDKDGSRTLAIQRFPHFAGEFARKKDHNRAEAVLLGYYGCTQRQA